MLIQQNSSMIKLVPATSNVKQANLLSNISLEVYLTWRLRTLSVHQSGTIETGRNSLGWLASFYWLWIHKTVINKNCSVYGSVDINLISEILNTVTQSLNTVNI